MGRESHLAIPIDDIAGGQGIEPAVKLRHAVVAKQNPIIDLTFRHKRLNRRPAVFVHGNAQHGEALRFVLLLKINKPRNLDAAGAAPGCPKVEQHHFAAIIGKFHGCAVLIFERKIGGDRAVCGVF